MKVSNDDPLLVDMVTAAKMLGISRTTIWSMANSGELPSVKIRRRRMFSPSTLREWIAQQEKKGVRRGQSA